jgi:cytochrome oxidase assembly protein ShyY1
LASLWLAAGFLALALIALVPAASSLLASWQIRKHDLAAAAIAGE